MMEDHRLDFHRTIRLLSFFKPSDDDTMAKFIQNILNNVSPTELRMVNMDSARKDWEQWLRKFQGRVEEDRECWKNTAGDGVDLGELYDMRTQEAKTANPRFVLRQWVLEEIIKQVENDQEKGKRQLAKVMHVRYFLGCAELRLIEPRWLATRLRNGVASLLRWGWMRKETS
ncbi:hypothetical protein BDP27DRAFT_502975 [Rhodocollybia butyracea]|uniref:Selenoprotein O n=1 Tax=Rhodocollybia butyracea TaxID=206335 RepID=A0A9P5P9P0_9AGAR|nr:hypothetical protein BDP27DRAFT_502975 [Rhodocollybia butyracea]